MPGMRDVFSAKIDDGVRVAQWMWLCTIKY